MAIKSKIAAITKEFEEMIKAAISEDITALKEHLDKVAEIYTAIQEAGIGTDVWADDKLKDTLATLGLVKKGKKESASNGEGKRLTGAKKEGLKPILIKVITSKKEIKRGELQSNTEVKTYCESVGVSEVPSLAAILKEMKDKDKTIRSEGAKSATVYKPK